MTLKRVFSIVVPVYQNESNLNDTVPQLISLAKRLDKYRLELVMVNDGSTDYSYQVLQELRDKYPEYLILVNLTRNFGQTAAIREGLKAASGDCIGIISADLQDPPELFLDMIQSWEKGYKLVIAERTSREEGVGHAFVSGLYWKMVSRFAVEGFPKGGFDFCLLDRQVRNDLGNIGEKNTSIFPLIFWLGYDYDIIPYSRKLREKGKSTWTLSKKIVLTINTFINFTYLPVQFMTLMGILTSFLAFLYSSFVLVRWLFWGTELAGWTTIVMLVSILGGIILFSLGIIGEYLWRILDETRKRPDVVVDEIIRPDRRTSNG